MMLIMWQICPDCRGRGKVHNGRYVRQGFLGLISIRTGEMEVCPRCKGDLHYHPTVQQQKELDEESRKWMDVYIAAYGRKRAKMSPPPPDGRESSKEYFERTGYLTQLPGETPSEWLIRYQRIRAKYERDEFGSLVRIKEYDR
jgi:uncharacterized protein YbaR (Trm112 family)